jgi:chromosome segregation ATPase
MNIKEQFLTVLLAFAALIFALFLLSTNKKLNSKISTLEGQKQQMEERIKELAEERLEVLDSILSVQVQVQELEKSENKLKQQNLKLETQIKSLKSKYEKAANHSINYNTDSIRRYFTDFN